MELTHQFGIFFTFLLHVFCYLLYLSMCACLCLPNHTCGVREQLECPSLLDLNIFLPPFLNSFMSPSLLPLFIPFFLPGSLSCPSPSLPPSLLPFINSSLFQLDADAWSQGAALIRTVLFHPLGLTCDVFLQYFHLAEHVLSCDFRWLSMVSLSL